MYQPINSFFFITDDYFKDFPDPNLKGNKGENRPYYYCFKDDCGIIWVIPLTSQIDKINNIISKKKKNRQNYEDLFHFLEIGGREAVLLIADMFPITEKYIKRPYTVSDEPFKLLDKKQITQIDKKAKRILALLRKGIKFMKTQPDILTIESSLKSKQGNV